MEAARERVWPSCPYRFVSYSSDCNSVDLWNGAGGNQQFKLISTGTNSTFFLKTSCGKYLSYPSDCSIHSIDTWPQAGINQEFRFTPTNVGPFEYYISAVGREKCQFQWLSFPVPCTSNRPDKIDFWSAAGTDQTFRIHPVQADKPFVHKWNSERPCADPFTWYSNITDQFQLLCTSATLELSLAQEISSDTKFKFVGPALGGGLPHWAHSNSRWAPENIEVQLGDNHYDVIFFAVMIPAQNAHRIGWTYSKKGPLPRAWDHYAPNFMDLGMAKGGDIDAHVFFDETGSKQFYLVWKTDDNNVGWKTTRIFAQRLIFTNTSAGDLKVTQDGRPVEILDSTGLWWSDSWYVKLFCFP